MFIKTMQNEKIVLVNLDKVIECYEDDGKTFISYEFAGSIIVAEIIFDKMKKDDFLKILQG